jgi:magnesium transporter
VPHEALDLQQLARPVWQAFSARLGEVAGRVDDCACLLCDIVSSSERHIRVFVLPCVEVRDFCAVPEGMITTVRPLLRDAIFSHPGSGVAWEYTVHYIFGSWLPTSGQNLANAPTFCRFEPDHSPFDDITELDYYVALRLNSRQLLGTSIMLINCVAYQDGKKLRDIAIVEISDFVGRPECFVWVALKDAQPAELEMMQMEFGLHQLAVDDAHTGHQRPKLEEYGDSLFVVVKTAELIEGELTLGEVDIFVAKNYILSVRSHSEQGFESVRLRCEQEPELLRHGAAFVLYALIDAVVDRYFPIIDSLESALEEIEERIFSRGSERANIEHLYQLKRKVILLRHAVGPLMEVMGRLHGGRVPPLCANTQEYFRDIHDHLCRISASLDAIRDTLGTAIQVNLSMVAIEEGEVNKRLAAWAAIFAVATLFAGVWGMNFKMMPELEWKYGYPAALTIMVGVCAYLYRRFKRAGWL